jgi:transcriptional regulator with XRE-family HTH domain
LELLAHLFDVPANHLWDDQAGSADVAERGLPAAGSMASRIQVLAAKFRQCRLEAGLSEQEMGQALGQPAEVIAQYEQGVSNIPLAELEIAAEHCGKSLLELVEDQPVHAAGVDQDHQDLVRLHQLPYDVREFVLATGSLPYLRIAQALSAIEPGYLRLIAETILDSA